MKITLNSQEIKKLSKLSEKALARVINQLAKAEDYTAQQLEERMERVNYNPDLAAIFNRNLKAEKRRDAARKRAAERRLAVKKAAAQARKEKPKAIPFSGDFLTWLAANWKQITGFFSINKHVNSMMSSRIANRYKQLRDLIAQAPAGGSSLPLTI